MVRIIDSVERGLDLGVDWARRRLRVFDHFWEAGERYVDSHGGRLAAAIAYYGFFASFALALLAYSILGFVMSGSATLVTEVTKFLETYLPGINTSDIQRNRGTVAIVGLIGLVLTGVGWVEAMRSSQRAIWHLEQQPGHVIIRWLVDLGMLVALGLLLALSLWITGGIRSLLVKSWLWATPEAITTHMADALHWGGQVAAFMVNFVIAAALMSAVPRLRMPLRRLLPPVFLVALGLSVLTTLNGLIVARIERNPALIAVSTVASLLVSFYLFGQLLLFGAALAATSRRGHVVDLAAGPQSADALAEMAAAAHAAAAAAAADAARLHATVDATQERLAAGLAVQSEVKLARVKARAAEATAAHKAADAVDTTLRAAAARDKDAEAMQAEAPRAEIPPAESGGERAAPTKPNTRNRKRSKTRARTRPQ